MFSSFFINIRRVTLLYMAMFILDKGWLQVLVFMSQNLLSTVFVLQVMPYEEPSNNLLNVFNECISLLISYYIAQNNDSKYDPIVKNEIGLRIQETLYFSWSCNFIFIMFMILRDIYQSLRKFYYKTLRWKCACLRPKPKNAGKKEKVGVPSKKNKNTEKPRYGRSSTVRRCEYEENSSARSQAKLIEIADISHKDKSGNENFVDEMEANTEDINFDYQRQSARNGVTNTSYVRPRRNLTGDPARDFFSGMDVILKKRTTFTREEIECIVSERSEEDQDSEDAGETNLQDKDNLVEPQKMLANIQLLDKQMEMVEGSEENDHPIEPMRK